MKKVNWIVVIAGAVVGIAAVVLTLLGNPANMGFCIACFLRDIAGGVGMHSAAKVQYIRPEIIGLVLGAFIMALAKGEFRAKAGSSPATRFVLGAFVMIGALAFLGCPLRMVIRLGGGDLNALVGMVGFVIGIFVGVQFLKRGFSLRRNYTLEKAEGGIRDGIMFQDFKLLYGFVAIFLVVLIGNLALGKFKFGFELQPIAHSNHLWNALGMVLVGWGSVLLGGCPLRQLILAGEGNGDSAITVFGMIAGAAFAHNFGLAGNPDSLNEAGELVVGGISTAGKVAVLLGIVVLVAISLLNMPKKEKAAE